MNVHTQFKKLLAEQQTTDTRSIEREVDKLQMELDSLSLMFKVWGERLDTKHFSTGELTVETLRSFEQFARRSAEQGEHVANLLGTKR